MKSCVVVRVKCDEPERSSSLSSLSLGGEDRSFSPFSPVFLCFLRVNDALAREHVARFFFFGFLLSLAERGEEEEERVFCVSAPSSSLFSFCSFSFSLSFSFERDEKRTTLFDALFLFPHL